MEELKRMGRVFNRLIVVLAVVILVPLGVKSCIDYDNARDTARQQQYERKNAWFYQHKCRRTSYEHSNAIYTCDDGEIYQWHDIPELK